MNTSRLLVPTAVASLGLILHFHQLTLWDTMRRSPLGGTASVVKCSMLRPRSPAPIYSRTTTNCVSVSGTVVVVGRGVPSTGVADGGGLKVVAMPEDSALT